MQHKDFRCEIKAVGEDGTFEGLLSVYGNVDQGGDVVERGAFAKTLKENGATVPMLWQHDTKQPIGSMELTDTPEGLRCKATFVLEVPQAQIAYALVKRSIVKGLSIGYDTIKDSVENGVRKLKELRLWEGSVVTFPMNMQAVIASVKAARAAETKDDFTTELQEIQIYAARYQMMDALCCSLSSILYDSAVTDKVAASATSIQQFAEAYGAMLPDYLALTADGMRWMSRPGFELKAGRMISQANLDTILKCISDLQALHDAATAVDGAAKSKDTSEQPEAVKQDSIEPEAIHSLLESFKSQLSGAMQWN